MTTRRVEQTSTRVHLLDGTYELFRQFFGQPPRRGEDGTEIAAVRGVIMSVLSMLGDGVTHLGIATDHVIESFRNGLWAGYKTGEGIDPALRGQFELLERALDAMGAVVWAMVELEADDALASAASVASADAAVGQVLICTPDKDLAQCVSGGRVVQLDRRSGQIFDEEGVRAKFGVAPESIPDWLALVGDAADGFPGLLGWGRRSAASVLAHYGHIASVPDAVADWEPSVRRSVRGASTLAARLAEDRSLAELFCDLATLRVEPDIVSSVETLRWNGPRPEFEGICGLLRDPALFDRASALGAS